MWSKLYHNKLNFSPELFIFILHFVAVCRCRKLMTPLKNINNNNTGYILERKMDILKLKIPLWNQVLYLFEEMQLGDKGVAYADEACIFKISGTYPPRGNPLQGGTPPEPGTPPDDTFTKIHFKYVPQSQHITSFLSALVSIFYSLFKFFIY